MASATAEGSLKKERDPKAAISDGFGLDTRQYEALEQDFQEVRRSFDSQRPCMLSMGASIWIFESQAT
jgi:hypothetical protein